MKTYNNKKLTLSTITISTFEKLKTKSGLIILLLLSQQSLFAQTIYAETNSDAYSNFIIVIVILLIASIFIGLEVLGDPKYESQNKLHYNKSPIASNSLLSSGYEFDKNITSKLTIVFYTTGILVVIYGILMLIMF